MSRGKKIKANQTIDWKREEREREERENTRKRVRRN